MGTFQTLRPNLYPAIGGLNHLTEARTSALLAATKKTESRVEGDPLAHLVRRFPEAFAKPVAGIFNAVDKSGCWPVQWKTEHLTIIPKVPNPGGLNECRNISCTSVFSKVLEGEVLLKLRGELEPDHNQYGGMPKCGAEHMLIDIWEKVLGALDGGQSAAVLLGVDYKKALNRMDHATCLEQLKLLGASEGSVALVCAFLSERRMTITINGFKATPVPILMGSPQGSVLGCVLYCVTTQLLTRDLRASQRMGNFFPQDDDPDPGVVFWEGGESSVFLYVDDNTLLDSAKLSSAVRHCTTSRTVEEFQQLGVAGDFDELSRRAKDIGMVINEKKTQLLIISPPNGCTTTAKLATAGGATIEAVDCMKLVGFTFGSSPGAGAHVESIAEKYKRKKWMLYHLCDAGFGGRHLFKLYCCYIRSIIEYCSPVYHSLLNLGQEVELERLQRHALRVCFGYDVPVERHMQDNNISTLKERRLRRCDAFIKKSLVNSRFGPAWFPLREGGRWNLRDSRAFQETQVTTLRRFNSPLSFLRRRANMIGVVPESWAS